LDERQSADDARRFTASHCRQAWLLHQEFKWAFIGPMKLAEGESGTITAGQIAAWIETHRIWSWMRFDAHAGLVFCR
jgi:hypothetical protein